MFLFDVLSFYIMPFLYFCFSIFCRSMFRHRAGLGYGLEYLNKYQKHTFYGEISDFSLSLNAHIIIMVNHKSS